MIDHLLRIKDKIKMLDTLSYLQTSQQLLVNNEVSQKCDLYEVNIDGI